jgi:DNA-binding XRE family transcriptional regulator
MTKTNKQLNRLWIARHEAGLQQKSVARLLGHRSTSVVSEYETGKLLPSLPTALKLSAIYRRSLSELYPDLNAVVLEELQTVQAKRASGANLRTL